MKRINLLPEHKQSELYYENLFYSVSVAAGLGVVILLLGILAQVGTWVYLQQKEAKVIREVEELQQQVNRSENAQVKQKIKDINSTLTDFETLSMAAPRWSGVLESFAKLVPKNVLISNFTASSVDGEIEIRGFAPTRELVIELYNNINADKVHFKDINYPLENVAKPLNVQFSFRFYIQDGILIQENK